MIELSLVSARRRSHLFWIYQIGGSVMSSISKHTSYETWTVADLIEATSTTPRGNKKVTIPEFQRRLVWSKKKQVGLIKSIKSGFPFGSLLVYKDNDTDGAVENYKLIDGLQRTQTLRQYTSHPNSAFNKSDLSDEFVEFIAAEINEFSDLNCLASRNKGKIRLSILEWIWSRTGFTEAAGWGIQMLTDVLLLEMLELEEETYELFMARKSLMASDSEYRLRMEQFLNALQKESDIDNVEVPVIIYYGPSGRLADVFVLLNTEGIKLHRYEVYAAHWLDYRYRIKNIDVIDAIWRKYAELANAGFNLDVYEGIADAESRIEHDYTLFEYLFGLGQYLTHNFPHLFKSVKVDQPSPFGFNLMSACISGSVAEKVVRKLPDNIHGLDLSRLEDCLLEAVAFVDELLRSLLNVQLVGQGKIPYFHADLQIVSMIATTFRVRYNKNDLSEIDGWEHKREVLARNLPMYFLYHVLQGYWRGSGDSKLADILEGESYLNSPPSAKTWDQAFDVWFRDHIADRQHERLHIKHDQEEYLLLRFILAKMLTATEPYHIQHIVPISSLKSPLSYYHSYPGPINSIGNLAIVAANEFVDYGDCTFVEYLNRQRSKLGSMNYHNEMEKHESLLICKENDLPSPNLTQNNFEKFLGKRFQGLKMQFLNAWRDCIPPDPQS